VLRFRFIEFGCLTDRHRSSTFVFAFIVKRFRVFRAPLRTPFIDFRFRIYRETLSRFSCATQVASIDSETLDDEHRRELLDYLEMAAHSLVNSPF
ncbi:hypothetical protein ABLN86_02520, partial [Mycobacterium tuberculosis]